MGKRRGSGELDLGFPGGVLIGMGMLCGMRGGNRATTAADERHALVSVGMVEEEGEMGWIG